MNYNKDSMKKSKKGEMSMQVIVVAVIALIVMVIVISVFSNKITKGSKEFESCQTGHGGICDDDCKIDKDVNGTYMPRYGNFSDCKSSETCCIKVG